MRALAISTTLSIAMLALSSGALADEMPARPVRLGVIAPLARTPVSVEKASLALSIVRDLDHAAVTTVYELANPSELAAPLEVVVPYLVRSDLDPATNAGVESFATLPVAVEVDGAPVYPHDASLGSLLARQLAVFLRDHPEIGTALSRDRARLRGLVEGAGGRCDETCSHLVAWQTSMAEPEIAPVVADDGEPLAVVDAGAEPVPTRDELALAAAREALPELVAHVLDPLGRPASSARFVLFDVDVPARGHRAVAVHLDERAEVDRGSRAAPVFSFDLRPATGAGWASFGPTEVSIGAPPGARVSADAPLDRDGDDYRGMRSSGAFGQLEPMRIHAMATDDLWLGSSEPRDYFRFAVCVVTALALAIGAAASRRWSGTTPLRSLGVALVTAGPLSLVASFAAVTALLAFGPLHALGYQAAPKRVATLVFAAAIIGALVSTAMAQRAATKPASGGR